MYVIHVTIHEEIFFRKSFRQRFFVYDAMFLCFVFWKLFPVNRQPLCSSETISTKIKEADNPATSGQPLHTPSSKGSTQFRDLKAQGCDILNTARALQTGLSVSKSRRSIGRGI